ncbi:MAG: NUDIX hydrolase [Pirellulales bacterium]
MSKPEILLETSRFRVVREGRLTNHGQAYTREYVQHPGAVTIIPLVDDDHLCLIRNYRLAVHETLVELPAGTIDAGEDPAETALREITEETGYRADRVELMGHFWMSPGILDERMWVFVAHGLTPGPPQREANEEIENLVVTRAAALEMVHDGTIQDAKTIAALMLLTGPRG